MSIKAVVKDQIVTDGGTTITVMELNPFNHLVQTVDLTEAGVAVQEYGVVMAPADAEGSVRVTFVEDGEEPETVLLEDIIVAETGDVLLPSTPEGPYMLQKNSNWFDGINGLSDLGSFDDAVPVWFAVGANIVSAYLYVLPDDGSETYPSSFDISLLDMGDIVTDESGIENISYIAAAEVDTFDYYVSNQNGSLYFYMLKTSETKSDVEDIQLIAVMSERYVNNITIIQKTGSVE